MYTLGKIKRIVRLFRLLLPRIFAFVLEHIFHLKEDEKNFGTIWASIFEPLDFIPVYTEMGSLLYEKPLRMHEKMAEELRFSPKKAP